MSYVNPVSGIIYPIRECSFDESLEAWARELPAGLDGPAEQSLLQAKKRVVEKVREFLSDPNADTIDIDFLELDQGNLVGKLDSFPPIFHSQTLEVFATRLKFLRFIGTRLRSLPPEIGQLRSLQMLVLKRNQLDALPSEIGDLRNLVDLDLRDNYLSSLPEEFCHLFGLEVLDLGSNRLRGLPKDFDRLMDLSALNLFNNRLVVFPLSLLGLRLDALNLSRNPLHVMPLNPFYLGPEREDQPLRAINLAYTEIPFTLRQALYDAVEAADYEGPNLTLPPSETEIRPYGDPEPRSLLESLKDLFYLAEAPPEEFAHLLEDPEWKGNLTTWLTRIADILNTKVGREGIPLFTIERKSAFCKKILKYMQLAERDLQFRERFFICISQGIETCGDRALLSILYIGEEYHLTTMDQNNLHLLCDFLIRGPWARKELEMLAEDKVARLRLADEEFEEDVEVYLGYFFFMKKRLDLFLEADEMLFPWLSKVVPEDIDDAVKHMVKLLSTKDAHYEILKKNPIWHQALERKYPEEYGAIISAKEACLAVEDPDYVAIGEVFEKDVVELTRLALRGSFTFALEEWAETLPEEHRQSALNQIHSFLLLKRVEGLDLSSSSISSLPPIFHPSVIDAFATRLKSLKLSNNRLQALPPEIGQLRALQSLLLLNNQIRDLPCEIVDLQALVALSLTRNELEVLLPEIGQLKSLKMLFLGHNRLRELPPTIGLLQSLESFDLSGNSLVTLPKQFPQVHAKYLYFNDNPLNGLDFFPFDLTPKEGEGDDRGHIILRNTQLPPHIMDLLRTATGRPDYSGPTITFS